MAITKYLFLDIDGVLNHKDWYKNINKYDYKRREFDPECVNRVIKILEKTHNIIPIQHYLSQQKKCEMLFMKTLKI